MKYYNYIPTTSVQEQEIRFTLDYVAWLMKVAERNAKRREEPLILSDIFRILASDEDEERK